MPELDDFLEHYGIRGMKWGVIRKSLDKAGGSSNSVPKEKEKAVSDGKGSINWPNSKLQPKDVGVTVRRSEKARTVVKTSGGQSHYPAKDALDVAAAVQKAHTSGVVTLSNAELKAVVSRMGLEQQYSKLSPDRKSAGQKFIDGLFKTGKGIAEQNAKKYAAEYTNRQIAAMLGQGVKAAAK
jgi:hypothetical protein